MPALCLASASAWLLACGDGEAVSAASPQAATASGEASAELAAAQPTRRERPLPAFTGRTLEGERLEISSLLGKRLLLFLFNPEVADAALVAKAVASLAGLRGEHNFEIVGVAMGSDLATAIDFVDRHDLDFRVFDDSSASISRRLGLRSPVAVVGADAEGYMTFGWGQFSTELPNAERGIEALLRDALRLPSTVAETEPTLGTRPLAPDFEAPVLDSDTPFRIRNQRGRPVVMLFFLHSCPHCHHVLDFLKEQAEELPADKRPVFVGVEVSGRSHSVRALVKERGLDFLQVVFDPEMQIRNAYGSFAGVPDLVLIDRAGRIAARTRGWREQEDPPLTRMRLAKLAGAPVPMLLRAKGYSGNEVCGVCHESQHETWQLTRHATAFNTLVEHGADRKRECVGCHVVGFSQQGGYSLTDTAGHLENVGCESCHGSGGPHLSPDFVQDSSYEPACLSCHDPKHSLGFEYATFRPKISHAGNAHLLSLPLEEKRKLLAERGRPRSDLLPTGADYMGSQACQSCHPVEHETWSKSPHARAGDTLVAKGEAANTDCLRCHTTGYGLAGGLPAGAPLASHPDRASVGCESCHGPGGDHVGEDQPRIGTILSLGDKCDSCVILQICGSCHDDANDPGFEFEVLDKIELQRHGTIEPGTGRPKGTSAQRHGQGDSVEAILYSAFRLLDQRG